MENNYTGSKRRLAWVLIFQVAIVLLVGLSVLGINIPVLRQVVGFIYLTFIPGIIILRILRLRRLSAVAAILYSVGLSLAFNMFLGLCINILYPQICIIHPFSTLPLIITWTVALGLLCLIAYLRDRDISSATCFKGSELLYPPVLVLILLPLLCVVGSLLVRFYQMNIVLVVTLFLVAIVPIMVLISRLFSPIDASVPFINPPHDVRSGKIAQSIILNFSIPEKFYPLAIYCIALTLLWHLVLPFEYLVQWDSFGEYYYANLVVQSQYWNWSIAHTYNAMLSVTILPATFSQLLDISVTEVYKYIYPLWYALVPLGLYEAYRKRFSSIQSFLAVFFFMANYVFFLDTPSVQRQMVAELFFVLLLMLVMEEEVSINQKALFTIFVAGLVVSHYSLSYLYLGFIFIGLVIMQLLRKKSAYVGISTFTYLVVISLAWYIYTSSSEPLAQAVNIIYQISQNFITELLNPGSRDLSYALLTNSSEALFVVFRILWYLVLLFTIVGAINIISDLWRREGRKEYSVLSIGGFALLGACVLVPFFSVALGVFRIFHLSSLILAPYCILGAEMVFRGLSRATRPVFHISKMVNLEVATTVILVLFFLFNSYLPFEITKRPPVISLPLATGGVRSGETIMGLKERIWIWSSSPVAQEVSSAEWLNRNRNEELHVWATHWQIGAPVLLSYGMIPWNQTDYLTPYTATGDIKGDYIYLGYVNVVLGYGTTKTVWGKPDPIMGSRLYWPIVEISPLLYRCAKMYSNGASEIYWAP